MVLPARPEVGKESYLSKTEGIAGKLREIPEDFVVNEIIENKHRAHWAWAQPSDNGRHCIVKITANNWDTHILVKEISKRLGIGQKAISFAGTKDKRALTTQYFSIMSSPKKIENVDLKNVSMEFLHKSVKPVRLGNLVGNEFKIRISQSKSTERTISAILEDLKGGFPNYFGIQRFGAVRPITHIVGKKIVQDKYEEAVWDYLCGGEYESFGSEARENLKKTKDLDSALEQYPHKLLFERQMIGHLTRNKDDYTGAIRQLPENLSKMLVHAYQSLIFNHVLNLRIENGYGIHKPLIGDNIIPTDIYGGPDQRRIIEVTERNQKKLEKRCDEGKAWIVGLLPGIKSEHTNGIQGELERQIMDDENIDFKDFSIGKIPELSSFGMYRPLNQRINDLKWIIEKDGSPTFEFWLHKGTYATSFLREIMKCEDMRAY
jgi:tRNA pseudouridine13 synthase|tara:strand:- start:6653 stop:7951 length:1299 start_codon:yes stop_codon:yes gene_type:complete